MRIISGIHKGRKITPPKNLPVRPTTDRAKEALFNILNNFYKWNDISVLDLFSGTGSISFEFASRGVKRIRSVDQNRNCISFINNTSNILDLSIITIKSNVLDFLNSNSNKFNIIFLDPPYTYKLDEYKKILEKLLTSNLLDDGLIIVEHYTKMELNNISGFEEIRKYGSNSFSFFKNKAGR